MKNNIMMNEEKDNTPTNSMFSKFKNQQREQAPKVTKPPLSTKIDLSAERKRANEAAKALAKQKAALSYEEEKKLAKDKKSRMDKIKNKYTNYSRSRSRKRSSSNGPKSCVTTNPAAKPITVIQSKAPSNKPKIRDNRTEISGANRGKLRKFSPDDTTKCTREEDLNIDQFLMDDLAYINKEEAKLQKEILIDHKNTIMKVTAVERKHNIDTKMVQTKQMVKKLNDLDPYETMKKFDYNNETEEMIEESLENLNYLLAQNAKSEKEKKKAYRKMAERMNIRLDSTSPVRQVPADLDRPKI